MGFSGVSQFLLLLMATEAAIIVTVKIYWVYLTWTHRFVNRILTRFKCIDLILFSSKQYNAHKSLLPNNNEINNNHYYHERKSNKVIVIISGRIIVTTMSVAVLVQGRHCYTPDFRVKGIDTLRISVSILRCRGGKIFL